MKNCALLTMDDLSNFECYDELLIEPLAKLGWKAELVSWKTDKVDWDDYDVVIIRSTWDYQDFCDNFLDCLEKIDQSSAMLANPLALVKWNINKQYLKELEIKGVKTVPTLWHTHYEKSQEDEAFSFFKTEKLIIKPCISAGADDTFTIAKNSDLSLQKEFSLLFKHRDFMLQPFMPAIQTEGEYSLFYFNGQYSHAIIKKPKDNDFRVQEEHGGQLTLIKPETKLLNTAQHALELLPHTTLYARLDFVRHQNDFSMMEAELIEPSLYFNMDEHSASRFADALVDYYRRNKKRALALPYP